MKVELIYYTPDGINTIARLARSTRRNELEDIPAQPVIYIDSDYEKWEKKNENFVKELIKMNHLGILEHIQFTFHLSEVSRCLTHQLVRHRMASYLQMSSRHVDLSFDSYETPQSILDHWNPNTRRKYNHAMMNARTLYRELVRDGIPKEDARYIIPDGNHTHISMTANARELRHFFELRCKKDAQWEIQSVAKEMLKICYETYPVLFEDLYKEFC